MNEKKLKEAFSKIKIEIEKLKKSHKLSSKIETQIKSMQDVNLEEFVINMENEFKSIKLILGTFDKQSESTSKTIQEFSKKISDYHTELIEIKNKFKTTQNRSKNPHLDIEMLEKKFDEFQEIMNEKISLEISSIKLEKAEELIELEMKIKKLLENNVKDYRVIEEVNDILNEKITLEVNSIRLEFTDEIAKIYDLLGERTITNKQNKKKAIQNKQTTSKPKKEAKVNKIEEVKIEEEPKEKKLKNKFKKVVKWLFVDDEEDDISNIKDEIEKKSK